LTALLGLVTKVYLINYVLPFSAVFVADDWCKIQEIERALLVKQLGHLHQCCELVDLFHFFLERLEPTMPRLRLDSWKSIAAYLDRSRRTVQRWHSDHGLPVHHFAGVQGSVFAYSDEIDAWLAKFAEAPRACDPHLEIDTHESSARSAELAAKAEAMFVSRSEGNIGSIAELYREAVDQDPLNERAHLGLALSMISSALLEALAGSIAFPAARDALCRAKEIDPQNLDIQCADFFFKFLAEHKWKEARAGFEAILRQSPGHTHVAAGLTLLLITDGDFAAAARNAWEQWNLHPLVASARLLACWTQLLAGDAEEAVELAEQFKSIGAYGPALATVHAIALASGERIAGNIGQIEAIVSRFPNRRTLQGVLGYSYAISGQTQQAVSLLGALERMSDRKKSDCGYALALILLGLGRTQQAVHWLEQAFEQGSVWSLGYRGDPILQPLRGEPRFEALLRKIGQKRDKLTIVQAGFAARAHAQTA